MDVFGAERALVLGYHTVSETWENSVAVRPQALRQQLETTLRAGYEPVTFSEAVASPERRVVAVTFDDAFLAVRDLALPVLDGLGMVATLFVPTSFVTHGHDLSWEGYDARTSGAGREMSPLSWDDVRGLADRGWEVGSHTRVHPHLPRLDDAALLEELTWSRRECSAALGTTCRSLAYPYGDVDRRVRAAAEAAGYTAAAALGPQWRRRDPLWWHRTGVYRGDDLDRFRTKLRGTVRSRPFAVAVTTARRLSGVA